MKGLKIVKFKSGIEDRQKIKYRIEVHKKEKASKRHY